MHMLLHPLTLLITVFCVAPVLSWDLSSITALRKRLPRGLVDTPHLRDEQQQDRFKENHRLQEWLRSQQPPHPNSVGPQIIMPGNTNPIDSNNGNKNTHDNDNGSPVLADVLPRTRGINIFASLTREFSSVESRLSDARHNVTVLAPRNSAIQDLPRKPWENPDDYARFGEAAAYEGEDGQDRAHQNLRRFVEAHVVPVSPWGEGDEVETLGGEKVRWRREGDKILIQPGDVGVESVAEKVSNGEVWVLNGVVNYR